MIQSTVSLIFLVSFSWAFIKSFRIDKFLHYQKPLKKKNFHSFLFTIFWNLKNFISVLQFKTSSSIFKLARMISGSRIYSKNCIFCDFQFFLNQLFDFLNFSTKICSKIKIKQLLNDNINHLFLSNSRHFQMAFLLMWAETLTSEFGSISYLIIT